MAKEKYGTTGWAPQLGGAAVWVLFSSGATGQPPGLARAAGCIPWSSGATSSALQSPLVRRGHRQ